jgi:hypothetical protein
MGWTRRVVFEPAIRRWSVRRRYDDAVGKALRPALVVSQNGTGNHRRRRETAVALDEGFHPVCGEHFERDAFRGARKRMGVFAQEKRARDALVRRYSQIAPVMARMCASVNVPFELVPR